MSFPDSFRTMSREIMLEALSIAWEVLKNVRAEMMMPNPSIRQTEKVVSEALRRIEELGKESK